MNIFTERARVRRGAVLRRKVYRKRAPACPVCHGLECLCRPRYFSGQLLTDTDLNAEQQYVIKKNQLHNLYLHGWGVVCGLEVVCHPTCEGWVTVKEGYAISPCGDDIIVCADGDFNVIKAIEDCERQQRRQQVDCTPRATAAVDCDPDGCWYLTLTYKEDATRAVTALRRDMQKSSPACSCMSRGCGCGGRCGCGAGRASQQGSGGCGCGCGGQGKTTAQTNGSGRSSMTPALQPPACEPTRWCENFRLDLCKAPDETAEDRLDRYNELLGDTLLGRIMLCIQEIQQLLALAPMGGGFGGLQFGVGEAPGANVNEMYQETCRFLLAVRDYFENHPTTHCGLLEELAKITCPSPQQFAAEAYVQVVADVISRVRGLLLKALVDCICLQLMPPCPEDPGDQRIYLACITVKDGKVVDICNFKGRKNVWTWPTVLYWLSIVPVVPLISHVIEKLCCGEYGYEWAGALLQTRWKAGAAFTTAPPDPLVALGQLFGAGAGGTGSVAGMPQSILAILGGMPHA